MDGSVRLRSATTADVDVLARFLVLAGRWAEPAPAPVPLAALLSDDHLARYLEGWGRPGDLGVVAEDERGRPVGAAWSRRFATDRPGYGFVDEATPEVGIAVEPGHRSAGLGTMLLQTLHDELRQRDVEAASLSVESGNPARRLYERLGYRRVGRSGGSVTMRCDLRAGPDGPS